MSELASNGGQPVRTEPFPPRIQIGEEEIDAVVTLMRKYAAEGMTNRYTGGQQTDTFEQEFAAHFGTRFATATSSGTAAIHSALGGLHLEVGSEVISSPITDPGAVMPILMQNCVPIFADVDPETMNITPESVAARVTDKTRAVIVGHIAGQPCDMDGIMVVANQHDLVVIEDCAQAHDAEYHGRKAGTIGHLGCFSLMNGKHITSGGQGGMVITNDEDLYWQTKRFADRGKPFNSDIPSHLSLGLNYRMPEIGAAIGRVQLKKLPQIVNARRRLVDSLREHIPDLQAVRVGKVIPDVKHSYWFTLMHLDEAKLNMTLVEFVEALRAEGIPAGGKYDHIIYEQHWLRQCQTYGSAGFPWSSPEYGREVDYEGSCPNARRAIDSHFLLIIHENWGEREIEDTAAALIKVEKAIHK